MGSRQAAKGWRLTSRGDGGEGEAEALRRRGRQAGEKEEATGGLLGVVEGIRRAHTHNRHNCFLLWVADGERRVGVGVREGSGGGGWRFCEEQNRKISEGPARIRRRRR